MTAEANEPIGVVRPSNPSITELRDITQPPAVRTRAGAEHWVASLYLRDLSPYLTRMLLKLGFSANGVTGLMVLAAAVAGFVTAWPGVLAAVVVVLL